MFKRYRLQIILFFFFLNLKFGILIFNESSILVRERDARLFNIDFQLYMFVDLISVYLISIFDIYQWICIKFKLLSNTIKCHQMQFKEDHLFGYLNY